MVGNRVEAVRRRRPHGLSEAATPAERSRDWERVRTSRTKRG
jgi:hypothetical protein